MSAPWCGFLALPYCFLLVTKFTRNRLFSMLSVKSSLSLEHRCRMKTSSCHFWAIVPSTSLMATQNSLHREPARCAAYPPCRAYPSAIRCRDSPFSAAASTRRCAASGAPALHRVRLTAARRLTVNLSRADQLEIFCRVSSVECLQRKVEYYR